MPQANLARVPILPTPGLTHPRFSRLRFLAAPADADGAPGAGGTSEDGNADGGFKPITTQEDLNHLIGERVSRAERKAVEPFADYDALKADAEKYRQGQESSKSDLDRATERIGKLEADLDASQKAATKARVQAKYKIADADADLLLTAPDEAGLIRQAEALAERTGKTGNRDPLAGRTPTTDADKSGMRDLARSLFGRD